MRKCLIFILILALLCPLSASAAEGPKYLALVFEDFPREMPALLEGLASRGVRMTFFLENGDASEAESLVKEGHELGILTAAGPELSRREIARELNDRERQLNTRIRLLRTTSRCSDGMRQVAQALGFSFVIPAGTLRALSPASDGDILLADGSIPAISLLELVDDLQKQGFTLVTVSELARHRGVFLRPGATYRSFPPPER